MIDVLGALHDAGLTTITGVNLTDLQNPATWRFDGRGVTAADRVRAQAVLAGVFRATPPASTFWPAPVDPLVADVARIKHVLGLA